MFLAIDGIDGAGKTTLVNHLAVLLQSLSPVITKEPTKNSKWGQRLRRAAIEGRLPLQQEIEYFHKDRLNHIENVIAPALDQGHPVITDRYVDSTLAFQASDPEEADRMYEGFLPEILVPDVTFILTCQVSVGLERILSRDHGSLTQYETPSTLETAKLIYESRHGENYAQLDASGDAEYTFEQAIKVLFREFPELEKNLNNRMSISPQMKPNKRIFA